VVIKVNDSDLRILALFTTYTGAYHIREVEKLLKVSSRTALVTLAKLEKLGILASRKRGTIKAYSIRTGTLSREFFLLAEQYKTIQFLETNPLIKEVLEKTDPFMQGIVIIFGSYAKGMQQEESDLDVFIVGTYDEKKMKEAGRRYGIAINIKSYPLRLFEKELHDDILLKEIKKHHILIKGAEGFVRRAAPWTRYDGV